MAITHNPEELHGIRFRTDQKLLLRGEAVLKDPHAIRWYISVLGGKLESRTLEHLFEVSDNFTQWIIPTPMRDVMVSLQYLYGKKIEHAHMWDPQTKPVAYRDTYFDTFIYPYYFEPKPQHAYDTRHLRI